MTPEQKIKHTIMFNDIQRSKNISDHHRNAVLSATHENIDEVYEEFYVDSDIHWDLVSEYREGEVETGLPCEWSRHYESKSVAAKMSDGKWVGWTYWYGGGKHSEPDAIDWMSDSYFLHCKEEEKIVTVRTFSILEDKSE